MFVGRKICESLLAFAGIYLVIISEWPSLCQNYCGLVNRELTRVRGRYYPLYSVMMKLCISWTFSECFFGKRKTKRSSNSESKTREKRFWHTYICLIFPSSFKLIQTYISKEEATCILLRHFVMIPIVFNYYWHSKKSRPTEWGFAQSLIF